MSRLVLSLLCALVVSSAGTQGARQPIRVELSDEAMGTTFTVIAWAFAHAFMAIQVLWPGSFTAAIDPEAPRTWFELLFLSFTNLTSVGLSDIVPVGGQARSVVMIEQVAGLMYIALVVSRIVGLTIARQRA